MLCYSDNVGKELKYNHYIFTSSTDSHAPRPKQQRCSEKNRHPKFGDTWETILMAPLQSVFCARTTQPKVTPTNHHLLIDIHHLRFNLGHQGLPRLHQSLEKPPASTKQEGYGEGGGVGGGEEVQGAPRSEERSLSNCCLMSCPQWTSCNGGSITRLSSPSCQARQEGLPSASYFI